METRLKERELPDDYPINAGYLYVVDGQAVTAIQTETVGSLKRRERVASVKSCDISGRNLWHLAV